MATNQEILHTQLLSVAGISTGTFNEAVIAANIANGGTATTFNGAWIELLQSSLSSTNTSLPGLMAEYAAANGFPSWGEINDFSGLASFSPADLENLVLWVDSSTLSGSGDVTSLPDLSGNISSFAVQASRVAPKEGETRLGDLPALSFSVSRDDGLESTSLVSDITDGQNLWLYTTFSAKNLGAGSLTNPWLEQAVICDSGGFFGLHLSSTFGVAAFGFRGTAATAASAIRLDAINTVRMRISNDEIGLILNGGTEVVSTFTGGIANINGKLRIGLGLSAAASEAAFDLGEIVATSSAPSAEAEASLFSYLTRWETSLLDLDLVAWYDPSDALSMWADITKLTQATSSLARIDDKSGNGVTLTQSTGAPQPFINSVTQNGLVAIDLDGTAEFLTNASVTLPTNLTAFLVFKSSGANLIPIHKAGSGAFPLLGTSGSTSAASTGSGTPSYYKNGDEQSITTRGDAYTVYTGDTHIMVIDDIDASAWGSLAIGSYNVGQINNTGLLGEIVLAQNVTEQQFQDAVNYLGQKWIGSGFTSSFTGSFT